NGATRAQIALAWVLAQKPWIVPIPSTTNHDRMVENSSAASVKLTESDLKILNDGVAKLHAAGERYSELHQRLINR
ncbi:MAG: aldo/keto reductase, partial [Nostoc sp.]